jgi:hypothetical protein
LGIEDKPEKKKRKASNVITQETNKEKKNLKEFLDE